MRSPLLHFLLVGGLLYVIQVVWFRAPETPVVIVKESEIADRLASFELQMGRSASAIEVRSVQNQVVDDALWLEQAFELGLPETDPVVRRRLLLNMRFLDSESEASDEVLVERAIKLGMDRTDTVVKRRLIDRVQAILRAGVRAESPDTATLAAHYEATAEHWREPTLLDLTHVYLSRDKRGDATEVDARALRTRFESDSTNPIDAVREGDPFLAGHRLRAASPTRLVARLGPRFAAGVENAPVGHWTGPIESAFGLHLVWIHSRLESRIPELARIEKRVLEDWIQTESRKALREYLVKRRTIVEIRIVDDRSAPSSSEASSG